MTFEGMEAGLRARLKDLPPAARAELIHVLRLPDSIAPTGSASSGGTRRRTFGELLIDLEEDKAARAVVFGLLAEMERGSQGRTASRSSEIASPPTDRI